MKYHVEVHGCQMNVSDAERIATVCEQNGYTKTDDWRKSDVLIYVSCSIKQKAEDKIIGHMKELDQIKKTRPHMKVGITGCMVRETSSQDDEKKDKILKRIPTVDFVFRMEDLDQLDYYFREETPLDIGKDFGDQGYLEVPPNPMMPFKGNIPIMTGCDNFCTFCIVPYSRGREQSRLMSEIIRDAKDMAAKGVTEILLLGQNVNSFGNKNDVYDEHFSEAETHPFTHLLIELNKIKGLKRIRYTSPNPKDITEELIEAMAQLDKVCEHVHIPLQSGDDEMLKRMNRHYSAEHFLSLITLIRKHMPRAGITTDIIVGFSGESEEQFMNTFKVCQQAKFDLSYTSKYSERKQTYAGRFLDDDIAKDEKDKRYHRINDLLRETSFESNKKYVGETWEILVDNFKDGYASGKTRTNRTVRFLTNEKTTAGDYVNVKIKKAREWIMEGEIINS
ncbi:MAG: tRNA (N6-isopentenyl adenosine(37)-C2)-methylthiotransferase MiaB [Candidatus Gracilibacteria bacterium]|nr:tRNA (N6-isopentenyl adenosine(37)-C2)-methylthiotransferase MiaB [Candidatus Gracilibacteria bacterium]